MRDREPLRESMWVWAAVLVVALGGLLGGAYFYQRRAVEPEPGVPAGNALTASPAPAAANGTVPPPAARFVREPEPPPEPLPPLDESDDEVLGFLSVFFGEDEAARFAVPERIVRNAVVTIDNLAREKVALQQRPIQPTPGELLVEGPEEALVLSAENFARYEPFVKLVAAADTTTMVALYRRLYPLFRQAYADLGLPGNFNTRLLEVIEHLLATPEIEGPIRLVRPAVLYEYEDPALEALTPGQKLLIRMGPENARAIKQKLREIRDELV